MASHNLVVVLGIISILSVKFSFGLQEEHCHFSFKSYNLVPQTNGVPGFIRI